MNRFDGVRRLTRSMYEKAGATCRRDAGAIFTIAANEAAKGARGSRSGRVIRRATYFDGAFLTVGLRPGPVASEDTCIRSDTRGVAS